MLVLPPVAWLPKMGLMYAGSTGANSVLILAKSASSSSATSMARAVSMPCPISDLSMMTVTDPSGAIRIQALGANGVCEPATAGSGAAVVFGGVSGGTAVG